MRIIFSGLLAIQLTLLCQPAQSIAAPCIHPPLGDEAIAKFKADPHSILLPGTDTRAVEAAVRDLAGSDSSLAPTIISVAQTAIPRYRTAIAAGLAQAAIACSNVDQQAGLLIQQAVAGFNNGEFQSAFAAVAGDLSTAATDAALASSASSVGSVVVTNVNSSGKRGNQPGGGGSTPLFEIVSGGIANNLTSAQTSESAKLTTAASPVSATR